MVLGSEGGDYEEGCDPVQTGKNVSAFRRNLPVYSSQLEMNFYIVKSVSFYCFHSVQNLLSSILLSKNRLKRVLQFCLWFCMGVKVGRSH